MKIVRVNEIFSSPQGEGVHAGVATVFVRLHGCNLDCPWCDQPSALATRPGSSYRDAEPEDVAEIVCSVYNSRFMLCVTGGEPFEQHQELSELLDAVARIRAGAGDGDSVVIFETNGTIYLPEVLKPRPGMRYVLSLSPKAVNSGTVLVDLGQKDWKEPLPDLEMHAEPSVLAWLSFGGAEKELKFVVEGLCHFQGILRWIRSRASGSAFSLHEVDLVFQPEWFKGRDAFREVLKQVFQCGDYPEFLHSLGFRSVRFLPQCHKLLGVR